MVVAQAGLNLLGHVVATEVAGEGLKVGGLQVDGVGCLAEVELVVVSAAEQVEGAGKGLQQVLQETLEQLNDPRCEVDKLTTQ